MDTQKISTLRVFQSFSHRWKCQLLLCCPKEFFRFLCDRILFCSKGTWKAKKDITWQISKQSLTIVSRRNNLEAKKRPLGVRKRLAAHKSFNSYRKQQFVLTASTFSSSLFLCTTRVWLPNQLKSRNFHCINLYKIPRTKLIHWRKKIKKVFAKADTLLDEALPCPVSSSQIHKL